MQVKKDEVKNRILNSAKKEFLEKGFLAASLRTIAQNANLTKGAVYSYFINKEALFTALVQEPAENLYKQMIAMQEKALARDVKSQIAYANSENPTPENEWLIYIYENIEAFKLVSLCSKGTKYEHYFDTLAQIEEKSTMRYIQKMKDTTALCYTPDKELVHILIDLSIQSIVAIIEHDIPQEKALLYWSKMQNFYFAGWKKLLFNL